MKKTVLALAVISFTMAVVVSASVMAATRSDTATLATRYAGWAGGKANADSLVNGLRNGDSITLVTVSADNKRSLAGFTAQTRMSPQEISAALAQARRTLAGFGIRQPSADQIQVALIGGELALPSGKTQLVAGSVILRMEPEPVNDAVTPVSATVSAR